MELYREKGVKLVGWKHAVIIPVRKRGKLAKTVDAYRPNALTSCVGKIMERMVNDIDWKTVALQIRCRMALGNEMQH